MSAENNIRAEREKRGWTQAQLADMCGVSERTIQRLEKGAEPSAETLMALAAVFELPMDALRESLLRTDFAAPMDKTLKQVSVVIVAGLCGLELIYSQTLYFSVLGLLAIYLLFSVKGYSLRNGALYIHHVGWSSKYSLAKLQTAEMNPLATVGTIRLFGCSYLFAHVGYFRSGTIGTYLSYVTDPKQAIVLTFAKKKLVITPDDPQAFCRSIKALTEPCATS